MGGLESRRQGAPTLTPGHYGTAARPKAGMEVGWRKGRLLQLSSHGIQTGFRKYKPMLRGGWLTGSPPTITAIRRQFQKSG